MSQIWIYSLLSVGLISLTSLAGVLTLSIKSKNLTKILTYMISFSAGTLLGDAFLHLLPELVEEKGFTLAISLSVLAGIAVSFVMEKIIHWHHCHRPGEMEHKHAFAWMNLIGDGVHNFLDGLIIGGAYLVSIPVGVATTIAVALHEIPQEISDFGVLIHGGFTKKRALFLNFLITIAAFAGLIITLVLSQYLENITSFLIPFAAGGFIYIAATDLIPEMHKEVKVHISLMQLVAFILGIALMVLLLFSSGHGHEESKDHHDEQAIHLEEAL